jgi:hypothetical protein
VTATPPNNDSGADKRRSARILHSVPIIVTGTDALGQPFKETTTTVMVSCTGCKYQSTHYVPKHSALTVEINRNRSPKFRRILQARVVWVQRPSNYRDHFHIAVEFDVPGNVWDVASPPENWFPHPEDIELEIPVTEPIELDSIPRNLSGPRASAPHPSAFATPVERLDRPDSKTMTAISQAHATAAATLVAELPMPAGIREKLALAIPGKDVATARHQLEAMVQTVVSEALAKELVNFRSQIETCIQEGIAGAVKSSLEEEAGLAIGKIVEQSNASASAIAEQVEKAGRDLAQKFDETMRLGAEAAAAKARVPRKGVKRRPKPESPEEI